MASRLSLPFLRKQYVVSRGRKMMFWMEVVVVGDESDRAIKARSEALVDHWRGWHMVVPSCCCRSWRSWNL